jgi:hypothetical protein
MFSGVIARSLNDLGIGCLAVVEDVSIGQPPILAPIGLKDEPRPLEAIE